MPATAVLVFVIFVDPCLVKRTKLFRQPSGPDEGADDDHATGQPQTAQGGLDPIASRSAADGSPRQSIPFGTGRRYSLLLLQGWAKGSVPTILNSAERWWARRCRAFAHGSARKRRAALLLPVE